MINSWKPLGTVFLTTFLSVLIAGCVGFGLFWSWHLEQRLDRQSDQVCLPSWQSLPTCYTNPVQLTADPTPAIAVNPTGTLLASSSQRQIYLWDLTTGRQVQTLSAHSDWITALAFSPDGQTLASSSLDQTIKLWNLKTHTVERTISAGRITTLAFSPDGQVLAGGSRLARWYDGSLPPQGVQRWDLVTGRSLPSLGAASVATLAFSPDGQWLASGAANTELWDLQTQQLHQTLDSGPVTALVFSADGYTLVSGSSKTKLWETSSGTLLRTLKLGASELLLSPNARVLIAASGGTINFWDLYPNQLLGSLRGSHYSSLKLRFGLQGQVLVSGSSDGLHLWRPTATRAALTQ